MTYPELIKDFAAKQAAFQARADAAVDGLVKDFADLDALVTKLQNSPGEVTPEDAATINELETKTGAFADKLEALDGLRPPAVPTPPAT